MIRTTPFRRMILHRSQRGLIDARTFMTLHIQVRSAAGCAAGLCSDVTTAASVSIVLVIRPPIAMGRVSSA